ncbi:zinc finger domain-containing protein [Saccharopolyspora sp. NPDC002376]
MSLTQNEVVGVLKVATAYDGRQRGEADVIAWMDSAARADWTYPEALEGVKDHFAFDGGFLGPAVVTKRIQARRDAAERARLAELGAAKRAELESGDADHTADPDRVRSVVEAVADRLGWQRKPKRTHAALTVACPHCQAAPGRPCARVIRRGHRAGEFVPLSTVHDSRVGAFQNGDH